jgi:hypothetical protein
MSPHAYAYPTVVELRRAGVRTDGPQLGANAPRREPASALRVARTPSMTPAARPPAGSAQL